MAKEITKRRGCSFGPPTEGALLTFVGSRWKLWGEKERAVEANHNDSVEIYTTACWGRAATSSDNVDGSQYIALGCASGRVQVWDPSSNAPLGPVCDAFHAISRGLDSAVTALAASQPSRASIFVACIGVPEILEVGVLDGQTRTSIRAGKKGVLRLASSPFGPEWLISVAMGSALKVWNLTDVAPGASPPAHARLAGPASIASCMDLRSTSTRVFALCADDSTQVNVYSCSAKGDASAGAERPGPCPATFVLSSHERIHTARFSQDTADGAKTSRIRAVGVGAAVVVCWSFNAERAEALAESGASKTIAPAFVVTADELGGRVLDAHFAAVAENGSLVVAYGNFANPCFASAKAPAVKGDAVTIQPLANSEVLPESADHASSTPRDPRARKAASKAWAAGKAAEIREAEQNKHPTVLGPLEASVARRPAGLKRSAAAVEGAAGAEELVAKRAKAVEGAGGAISLAPVVRQALRAKDGSSVDKVLESSDQRVMDSTVAELSGAEAFDLLQECTQRLVSHTGSVQNLCGWIQRALLHHCAFVRSQPFLHKALQPLHDAFESRSGSHRTLVQMRGRLRALSSFGRQAVERKNQEAVTVRAPLLQYTEGDEDDDGASSSGEEGSDKVEEEDSESGVDLDDILADDSDF